MSSDGIMRAPPVLSSGSGQIVVARLIGRPVLWLPALWLAALLFYLPTYLHFDVSWYLIATERFVSGARLYQDVIEVNPPLAFYLMAPPVLAAGMTGIPSRMLFVAYVFLPLALSLWLMDRQLPLVRTSPASLPRRRQLIGWATAALALLAIAPAIRGPFHNPFTEKLLPIVEKYASGGAIYAFTSHVWVGFPLVNEAGVRWSSRFPTLWLLPGAREKLANAAALGPERKRKLQEIERYVTDAVAADFERLPPDLVIVDIDNPYMRAANFDYLAYFQRDPRLARLWQSYVKIGEVSLEVGASPLSGGTKRVFDLWCRKSGTHECPALADPAVPAPSGKTS